MPRELGETLYDFVQRRERELENMADALRSELATVENELAHVHSARRQMANLPDFGRTPLPENPASAVIANSAPANPPIISPELAASMAKASEKFAGAGAQIGSAMSAALASIQKGLAVGATEATIKELVMKAITSSSKLKSILGGWTASEIRLFVLDAYGRDISPQSLSPQLSRLKAEGSLAQHDDDHWFLTAVGALRYGANVAQAVDALAVRKFKIAKPFNTQTQRFAAGIELEFKNVADLVAFAKNLRPLDFDHLVNKGFLEIAEDTA